MATRRFLLCAALLTDAADPAMAQAGRAEGEATAQVVAPLRIASLEDLDFGCMAVTGAGRIAIEARSGAVRHSGGVSPAGCTPRPARFAVTGEPRRLYRFEVEPEAVARHVHDPAEALPVSGVEAASVSARAGAPKTAELDGAGEDRLVVGGTLDVPATARPGQYIARIKVTVTYE